MSDCSKISESFSGFIDGVLPAEEAERVEAHLRNCAECAGEVEAMRGLVELMSGMEKVDPPAGFTGRVNRRLEEEESLSSRARRLARKIFLPLPVKLPIELAGLAAAVVLVSWMSGHLGREGIEQMKPVVATDSARYEMAGRDKIVEEQPAAAVEHKDDEMKKGTSPQQLTGDAEDTPVDIGSREKREELAPAVKEKVADPDKAAGKGTVADDVSVANTSVRLDGVSEANTSVPADDGSAADRRGVVGEIASDQDLVPPSLTQELMTLSGATENELIESISVVIDSLGGRLLSQPEGEDSWQQANPIEAVALKGGVVKSSRSVLMSDERVATEKEKIEADGALKQSTPADVARAKSDPPEPIYLTIHTSLLARLLETLERNESEYLISTRKVQVGADSILVRIEARER